MKTVSSTDSRNALRTAIAAMAVSAAAVFASTLAIAADTAPAQPQPAASAANATAAQPASVVPPPAHPPQGMMMGGNHGNMMGGPAGGMMNPEQRMTDELKLSDAQRKAFQEAMHKTRSTMDDHMAIRKEIHDAVEADKFDEKALRESLHKHYADMENKDLEAAKAMHEFQQSLTPEQKEKMQAMRKGMHDGMRERLKERMQDHQQEHRHLEPPATLQKKPEPT